ncbi:MAG: hypothetical protein R3C11_29390 [Planctomycetaceae bacterium]
MNDRPCDHGPHGCDDEKCSFIFLLRNDQVDKEWSGVASPDQLGLAVGNVQVYEVRLYYCQTDLVLNDLHLLSQHGSRYTQVWRL